jgi:hypothetical protein
MRCSGVVGVPLSLVAAKLLLHFGVLHYTLASTLYFSVALAWSPLPVSVLSILDHPAEHRRMHLWLFALCCIAWFIAV